MGGHSSEDRFSRGNMSARQTIADVPGGSGLDGHYLKECALARASADGMGPRGAET